MGINKKEGGEEKEREVTSNKMFESTRDGIRFKLKQIMIRFN